MELTPPQPYYQHNRAYNGIELIDSSGSRPQ